MILLSEFPIKVLGVENQKFMNFTKDVGKSGDWRGKPC